MSEILHVAKVYGREVAFLNLSCGHWAKWSTHQPTPKPGADVRCPTCNLPVPVAEKP